MPSPPASFKQRLQLDEGRGEYRDGNVRYLMLRADVLMGLFTRLDPAARAAALAALKESVTESGGQSVATYFEATGRDAAQLLNVLEVTAAQLGWGAWRFDASAGELRLEVCNSPFAQAAGRSDVPVCQAIQGIAENAARLVLDGPVTLTETCCAARDGGETCRFHGLARP